jgi:hypothetical protein
MREGDNLVFLAVIEEDGNILREAFRKIGSRLDVIAWPPAFTDEWRSDEEYAAESRLRQELSHDVNQDCGADRVAHEDCTVFKVV